MLDTIERLSKWNGHLYNWYNTLNLAPLTPRYISTVDSGNLVGYMYTTRAFLEELDKTDAIEDLINKLTEMIEDTDFKVLPCNHFAGFPFSDKPFDLDKDSIDTFWCSDTSFGCVTIRLACNALLH